jgi:superfamily II DNA or RNA helicase
MASITPTKQLSNEAISAECSISSFQRGKSYCDAKRVTDFRIEQEQPYSVAISSRVKGSHATPYQQLIAIKWQADYKLAAIAGRCSCPIGYNCKHVAAACLEYQKHLLSAVAAADATACFDWLESMDEDEDDDIEPSREFLAYLLKPSGGKQELTVDFVITKLKKSGGLTKGRSASLSNLIYSFGYRIPAYLRGEDEEIVKLLNGMMHLPTYQPLLKGSLGSLVLSKMLGTGRLFWQDLEKPPLLAGEMRVLNCSWQADAQGDYLLTVKTKPAARLILTEPPYYFDSKQGTLGPVDSAEIGAAQLRKLLAAPPVPEQYAEQFSQRLILEYPHLRLPPPRPVEVKDADNLPVTPRLSLLGREGRDNHYFHLLKLGFDYGEHCLPAYQSEPYTTRQTPQGYLRIRRDLEYETQCIDRLFEAGFAVVDDPKRSDLLFYSPGKSTIESAERWNAFLQQGLPALESLGWLIETDDSFFLSFQTASDWDAEIEEGRNDWFEMRFNIDINGQSLPLLPLLMPVLENYDQDNLPEMITVPLGNHQYLTLPSEKLKPFLAILFEMFGSLSLNDSGGLRLSRFDAAGLAELESHSYGLFSLKGGEALRELGRKIKNFGGIADVAIPDGLQAELRHYQQQGLNWLQFLREYRFGGILADDMGLGKTVQTLTHLLLEKQSGRMVAPCLIIAPTSLMSNWRREAARFTPDLKVLVLQGSDRKQQFDKINDYDLVLTTYPLLPRDEEFLLSQKYYYLILDEAQIVKNPNAKAAKIVRAIKAEQRLCLTGTPMENHLGELWTQFDFLMPGFLGDNASFKRLYRTPIEIHGNGEQRQRLVKRIAPFMLRRTKQEVVAELPPKTEIVRSVPLGQKQAMLYESIRLTMEQKVRQAIAEKGLARSHITILDALLKLRQTCCDPRTLPLAEAKKVKESAKLELLMEMLPELLEEGRRILLFSQFTRMIALIEAELDARHIAYSKLTGQTKHRDEAIERFKSGAADVFLISLKAGGVGLNLTEADTVIVYDPWWNPAAEDQAADRAHRIGQDKPVFVYKLITENTVEEKILAMQEKKRALAQGVYDGDKKGESLSLTADDLSALFEPL